MTKQFNATVHCPHCHRSHSQEQAFGRWMRGNPKLDAQKESFTALDIDFIVHRYKTHKGRSLQTMMFIEVKTNGAELSDSQRDTLTMLSQITKSPQVSDCKTSGEAAERVFSRMLGGKIDLKWLGVHVLTFSGLGPDDSDSIIWNKTEITKEQLTALLHADIDPITLGPINLT